MTPGRELMTEFADKIALARGNDPGWLRLAARL